MELREREQLFLNILRLAEGLGVSFAFPTQTLHMFQQTAAAGSAAAELTSPALTGQKLAAEIAGPLIDPAERLGPVEFSGPSDVAN
jgi:MscS family membrane protein